jgi:glycosyltransferase involved in cell wall biosynthesis
LRRAGKPYLLVLRGGNLPKFLSNQGERGRKLLRSARCVMAPSAYLKEELREIRDDIELLPNPLEVSNYEFRVRRQIEPRLVWLRGFRYIYKPAVAVETLARLRQDYPGATLLMIGPDRKDGSMAATRAAIGRHGLAQAVEIIPGVPKNEVGAWLQKGDVFLNTTGIDNTPISVLEAMACGVPVISTNVGGLPYLLSDGVDALLVPPDDAEAMAQAALRLLRNPEETERLVQAARRKAEACDWSVVFPRWEQLLRRESGR